MKKLLFTVLKGDERLFSRAFDIKPESLKCSLIKMIVYEILGSFEINSKKLFAMIRHCIFKLIRLITSTKGYEEWLAGKEFESSFKDISISARFVDEDKK